MILKLGIVIVLLKTIDIEYELPSQPHPPTGTVLTYNNCVSVLLYFLFVKILWTLSGTSNMKNALCTHGTFVNN